jgi:UPF0176 protein
MKIKNLEIAVYTFYRFKKNKNLNKIKEQIDKSLSKYKSVKGTILIANEGINGSLAGIAYEASSALHDIKKILSIRKLSLKINSCDFVPFYKLRTKIKKEIVSMGINNLNVSKKTGKYINAVDWNDVIIDNTVTTIDVRNTYERKIGYFKNSKNINMNSFREFPKIIKRLNLDKKSKIAMYCTGGIRCEKASSYLIEQGYKNVMQLEGGIINYLNKNKNKKIWNGECFVFDNRISINSKLLKGKYKQCYGCRSPISEIETKSPLYIRGVSCPNCYKDKNDKQKKRYSVRQHQIDIAESKLKNHSFKKIYLKDLP